MKAEWEKERADSSLAERQNFLLLTTNSSVLDEKEKSYCIREVWCYNRVKVHSLQTIRTILSPSQHCTAKDPNPKEC